MGSWKEMGTDCWKGTEPLKDETLQGAYEVIAHVCKRKQHIEAVGQDYAEVSETDEGSKASVSSTWPFV